MLSREQMFSSCLKSHTCPYVHTITIKVKFINGLKDMTRCIYFVFVKFPHVVFPSSLGSLLSAGCSIISSFNSLHTFHHILSWCYIFFFTVGTSDPSAVDSLSNSLRGAALFSLTEAHYQKKSCNELQSEKKTPQLFFTKANDSSAGCNGSKDFK